MALGRPTSYSPEILEKALYYLEHGWKEEGDAVPQIAGLALAMGITRETVYQWSKDPEKSIFSDIFKRVMQFQERHLINGGLQGGFNPAITKMLLTKHGYSDKQEIDHTSAGNEIKTFSSMYATQRKQDDGES